MMLILKYIKVFEEYICTLTSPANRAFRTDRIWIVAQKNTRPIVRARARFAIVWSSFQRITIISPTT